MTTNQAEQAVVPYQPDNQRLEPFIHKFKTKQNKYIYDAGTSRILRVDDVTWDIIESFEILSLGEIASRYSSKYSPREIAAAWERIANKQDQDNLLLTRRSEAVEMPYSQEKLEEMLSSKRTQLILNMTETCNFRCSYCVYSGEHEHRHTHSSRSMTWQVAREAIDEFLDSCNDSEIKVVSFYGGEPLLNLKLIKKCLSYVRNDRDREDIQFAITINGSLLTGEAADFLSSNEFSILVSLDGPANIHDHCRKYADGLSTWLDVTENLRSFLERHPKYKSNGKINFTAVLSPPVDLNQLQEFFEGYDLLTETMNLNVNLVNVSGSGEEQAAISQQMRSRGISELYEQFISELMDGTFQKIRNTPSGWIKAGLFERPFLLFHKRKYYEPHLPDRFCSLSTCVPGIRRVFVSIDGDYYPCERTPESEYMRIGNTHRGIRVSRVKELLEEWIAFTSEDCRHCWCLPICGVGCFANINEKGKVTENAKRKACEEHRQRIHGTIIDYCRILEKNPEAFDYMVDMRIT